MRHKRRCVSKTAFRHTQEYVQKMHTLLSCTKSSYSSNRNYQAILDGSTIRDSRKVRHHHDLPRPARFNCFWGSWSRKALPWADLPKLSPVLASAGAWAFLRFRGWNKRPPWCASLRGVGGTCLVRQNMTLFAWTNKRPACADVGYHHYCGVRSVWPYVAGFVGLLLRSRNVRFVAHRCHFWQNIGINKGYCHLLSQSSPCRRIFPPCHL